MNCMKRAVLYNVRKKGKTLFLFLILLVMAILLLTCFCIQRAAKTAALNVRQSLKGSFTIDARGTGGQLTESVVQEIRQIQGIEGYNGRSTSYAEYLREDGTPLKVMTEGAFQVVEGFEHAGKVVADSYSEEDEFFIKSGFEIKEGSPVIDGDGYAAVVHRWLADENDLQIGDTILLGVNARMSADDAMTTEGVVDKKVPVKIIGIFESTEPQEEEVLLSHVFYENTIFIDHQSYSELFPENGEVYYETADFRADDPGTLDTLIGQVKETDGVDWQKCTFTKHAVEYENARDCLHTLEGMMSVLSCAVMAVSAALLILILALWAKGRVHETGVFVAMGIGKGSVFLQHLTEVCLTAVFAFAIAAVLSRGIAQTVGEGLLMTASAPEYEVSRMTETDQAEQMDDTAELTQIQINVSGQDVLLLYGAGILLIVFSAAMAAVPVLKLKPKEILTKMN